MTKSDGADYIEEQKLDSMNIAHQENLTSTDQVSTKESELETAKAEMGEVIQENERLNMVLQHLKKDYESLQLRFFDIVKQDQHTEKVTADYNNSANYSKHDRDETEESELVSLSLGRSPRSEGKNVNVAQDHANNKSTRDQDHDHDQDHHDGHDHDLRASLTLGLGSEMQLSTELVSTDPSPENSSEEVKESAEAQSSNKLSPKTLRNNGDEHEVSHEQPPAKRARVSVRARCDTPTMNDGCQWRKYGQKIAKGNPCPRAYYRCTVAQSCPVRKQVQRCAEDMSILITTYEGTHNHPLPVTATAMASTTSAAASMLLSGSSTSSDPTNVGFGTAATKTAPPTMLNGLNFGNFDTMRTKQFYLPYSTTPNSSPLFPTITLDLTTSPISSSSSSSTSSPSSSLARIPSSSLSFGNSSEPNILPTLWGSGSSYLGYGNTMLPYDKAHFGSLNLGKQSREFLYQRCLDKIGNQANISPLHESLTETLTKAITSDPGAFKSVIAAAISSMVGGREACHEKQDGVERLGQGSTLGEQAVSHNDIALTQNGKGLASGYFNRLSSSHF